MAEKEKKPMSELQKKQLAYDKLVHTKVKPADLPAHKAACKKALADKRAAAK